MIGGMITRLVMWWIHRQYLKYGETIFYIRGTGRDYPRYLLYTEEPRAYEEFDRIGTSAPNCGADMKGNEE